MKPTLWRSSFVAPLLVISGCGGDPDPLGNVDPGAGGGSCSTGELVAGIVEPISVEACAARTLTQDSDGRVGCVIAEAIHLEAGQGSCDAPGREPLCSTSLVDAVKQTPEYAQEQWSSFCRVAQLDGAALVACLNDLAEPAADGWCFVDADPFSGGLGNPELVASCPDTTKRMFRFVGQGRPDAGAQLFMTCYGPI